MRDTVEPGSCLCDPRGHRLVSTKPLLGSAGFPAGGKARSFDEALPSGGSRRTPGGAMSAADTISCDSLFLPRLLPAPAQIRHRL